MFKKALIFSIVTLATIVTYGQKMGTVNGTVKDSTGKGIDVVNVVIQEDQKYQTITNKDGRYTLQIPADKKYTLVFSSLNTATVRKSIIVLENQVLQVDQVLGIKENTLPSVDIETNRNDVEPSMVDVRIPEIMSNPKEDISAYLPGARSSNELSTAYSVRGGNFDENLVYVNDFEVYRPFLIRSGQQEGLSFANPNMVSNVKFSTGGFQARYGDKMSSVLDVIYRKPKRFGGSIYGSLLGFGGHLEGCDKKEHFTFIIGIRQRLSTYILRSLDQKGQYNPNFLDVQGFFTYRVHKQVAIEYLVNYSRNTYLFKPENRETTFGVLTDVKKFTVYFDGQEVDRYQTLMNGLSVIYTPKENMMIKFLGSQYHNSEKEAYDILGEYYLSQVESDLGKDNFGEVLYSLGIGGLHDWARNTLKSDIYYGGHRGAWQKKGHNLQWGVDYKREVLEDRISEWNRLDSAGHSIPYNFVTDYAHYDSAGRLIPYIKSDVSLNSVIKSSFSLKSNRISAFIQDTWKFGDTSRFSLNYGVRFQYWDVNKEPIVTPRVQFSFKPKGKGDVLITAAAGTYYQPPFYREMRTSFDSVVTVNTSLKAQKSFHGVFGVNYAFKAWKRNFSFITELYGKYLWDQVPYEFDNVLIRYFGTNSSVGYAAGIDMRLNGELAEGLESWITLGVMSTMENLKGDKYTAYYDSSGAEIPNTSRYASQIVDSSTIYPGWIPRPTDQRVNFSMYFQDYIPKFKFIKVNLNLVFATGFPFGPPDHNKFKDTFRIPPYRRVDIGFSGQLWNPIWAKKKTGFNQGLKSVWLSLEVFNIFGITNTVSYLWVSDVNSVRYAIPNYLTSRRINVRLQVNF